MWSWARVSVDVFVRIIPASDTRVTNAGSRCCSHETIVLTLFLIRMGSPIREARQGLFFYRANDAFGIGVAFWVIPRGEDLLDAKGQRGLHERFGKWAGGRCRRCALAVLWGPRILEEIGS